MADEDDIRIRAELENHVSRPAEQAADSIEDIGDSANRAEPGVILLERALNELADEMRKTARDSLLSRRGIKSLGNEAAQSAAKVKLVDTQVDKLNTNLGIMGGGPGSMIAKGTTMLKGFGAQAAAVLPFIAALPGALGAAAGGVGQLGYLATQLSGTLVILPAGIATLVQSVAVLTIGFKGLGEAWEALNDPTLTGEEVRKALKGMAPEAIDVLMAVKGLRKEFTGLKKEVQGNLFAGLDKQIERLGKVYGPILNKELGFTADQLNKVFRGFGKLLSSREESEQIGRIMHNNAIVMRLFGKAGVEAWDALSDILDAARPMWRQVGKDVLELFKGINDWTSNPANANRMRDFFMHSWDVFKQTLGFLWDIGAGLINIFKGAAGPAGETGKSLRDIAKNFREWTESEEGQKKIQAFFRNVQPAVKAVGRFVKNLGEWLIKISEDPNTIRYFEQFLQLMVDLLPVIRAIILAFTILGYAFKAFAFLIKVNAFLILLPFKLILAGLEKIVSALAHLPGPLGSPFRKALPYIKDANDQLDDTMESLLSIGDASDNLDLTASFSMDQKSKDNLAQLRYDLLGINKATTVGVLNKLGAMRGMGASRAYDPYGGHFDPMIGQDSKARWMGGPVNAGTQYTVTEKGPELLINSKGVSLLDSYGPKKMTFDQPGYILPNDALEALTAPRTASDRDMALALANRPSSPATGRTASPVSTYKSVFAPQIDAAGMSKEEVEQMMERLYRKWQRDEKDKAERANNPHRRNR